MQNLKEPHLKEPHLKELLGLESVDFTHKIFAWHLGANFISHLI